MVVICLIVICAVSIGMTPFNLFMAKGKIKQNLKVAYIVTYSVLCLMLVLFLANSIYGKKLEDRYGTAEGGIDYESTVSGYHLFYKAPFLDGGLNIAVPATVDIPSISKYYRSVKFYRQSSDNYDGEVEINGEEYYLAVNIGKIAPDFFDSIVTVSALDVLIILLTNITGCIIVIAVRRKDAKMNKELHQKQP